MTLELKVPKIACSACVETVTKAIREVDATAQVNADPKTKRLSVQTQTTEEKIKEAIASVGYPAE